MTKTKRVYKFVDGGWKKSVEDYTLADLKNSVLFFGGILAIFMAIWPVLYIMVILGIIMILVGIINK